MTISFVLPENKKNAIKVIGVGGGGGNAVEYMFNQRIEGVDFIVCNTDAQALENSPVPNKVQLGIESAKGMGAGSNPEKGYKAALESEEFISELFDEDTKMVFITAGMGGGTGTGAAPVIAKISKEKGKLTVGIVTIPFDFEGKKRLSDAKKGIKELRKYVDALIVINNNKLVEMYGDLGYHAGFAKADEVLATAAKGIAQVITHHYKRNIDLNDARTVLADSGNAIMGSATAAGENRAKEVITKALHSPLLNDNRIEGATKVLLLIVSGTKEVTFNEINYINEYVQHQAGGDVNIILGMGDDHELGEAISVTVIATGFPGGYQENISVVDKEKIIHVLNDDQMVQFDLFDSVEDEETFDEPYPGENNTDKRIVHKLEEDDTEEQEPEPAGDLFVPDEILDIEVDFTAVENENTNATHDTPAPNDANDGIKIYVDDELPARTAPAAPEDKPVNEEDIMEIEVVYEEIIRSKMTSTPPEDEVNAQEELQMELPLEFEPATTETTGKKIVHTLEEEAVAPAQGETQVEEEPESAEFKVIEKQPGEVRMHKPAGDTDNEEFSPLRMTISEVKKNSHKRKNLYHKYNYTFNKGGNMDGSNIEDMEKEPAYKRMGIDLDNDKNDTSKISRTSLEIDDEGDVQLRSNNSFLHDNVD